jgi:hypothetical protein
MRIAVPGKNPLPVLQHSGEVVISVDPSKTNMAMIVAFPTREVLSVLQFSAAGAKNDNSEYCRDFKVFLRHFLQHNTIYDVGIEAAITKKGAERHYSAKVLWEIRANLISLFLEDFNIKPKEINNQAWKSAILPDSLRSHREKGSTRYLAELFSAYHNSDVTDAMCMLLYLTEPYHSTYKCVCNSSEQARFFPKITLLKKTTVFPARNVTFNPQYSLMENVNFYTNRFTGQCLMHIPTACLTLADIHNSKTRFTDIPAETEVSAVICRSG